MSRITGPFERPETLTERVGSWWERLVEPWSRPRNEFEIRLLAAMNRLSDRIERMEERMAADRDLLASIAEGLTALATPIADLIASEAALRVRVVELEGAAAADEAGDLEAAQGVKAAFDELAGKFTAEPEAPDVEPLPEPEPAPEPEVPAEPVADEPV